MIHLCGAGAGRAYAQRHLRLLPGQRCGDHDVGAYLGRIRDEAPVRTAGARRLRADTFTGAVARPAELLGKR